MPRDRFLGIWSSVLESWWLGFKRVGDDEVSIGVWSVLGSGAMVVWFQARHRRRAESVVGWFVGAEVDRWEPKLKCLLVLWCSGALWRCGGVAVWR